MHCVQDTLPIAYNHASLVPGECSGRGPARRGNLSTTRASTTRKRALARQRGRTGVDSITASKKHCSKWRGKTGNRNEERPIRCVALLQRTVEQVL